MNKRKVLLSLPLCFSLLFVACEKEKKEVETVSNIEKEVVENRAPIVLIGDFHNEILGTTIVEFGEINGENEEEVFNYILEQSQELTGETTDFSYVDFSEIVETYVPLIGMSMDEAVEEEDVTTQLISKAAIAAEENGIISANLREYYVNFNDVFFATSNLDEVLNIINETLEMSEADMELEGEEKDHIAYTMDIAQASISYWDNEYELGEGSDWPDCRRYMPRWIRRLLKGAADICAGVVVGVPLSIGLTPWVGVPVGVAAAVGFSAVAFN